MLCGATSTHPQAEQQTWLTMQSACLTLAWAGLFSRLAGMVPISFLSFPDFLHPLDIAARRATLVPSWLSEGLRRHCNALFDSC